MRQNSRSCTVLLRAACVAFPVLATGCSGIVETVNETLQLQPSKTSRLGQSLLDAAQEAERRGDYPSAANYYGSVYERDQENNVALVGLSRNLRRLGRATEAEAVLSRALKREKETGGVLSEMGKVQLVLGQPMEAIEPLSRASVLGEDGWDVQLALAVAYDRIGMYDKAEGRYRAALKDSPDNAVVLNNFALSMAQAGQLRGAIGLLERATALPEATPKMRQNLALLYAMNGDLKLAEALVRRDLSAEDAEANMAYYRKLHEGVTPGAPIKLPGIATEMGQGVGTADPGNAATAGKDASSPASSTTKVPASSE
jgi:Flp pilus assembly protein TadD